MGGKENRSQSERLTNRPMLQEKGMREGRDGGKEGRKKGMEGRRKEGVKGGKEGDIS